MEPLLIALEPLPQAFATFLSERTGFQREDASAVMQPSDPVFTIELPFEVELSGFVSGLLVLDFSRNPVFCGGAVPGHRYEDLVNNPAEAKALSDAESVRWHLKIRRVELMNALLATLYQSGQTSQFGFVTQKPVNQRMSVT